MTHQDLLNYWVDQSLRVIGEWSENFDRDARELRATARVYAEQNGLTLDETVFDIYIYEDEL